MIKTWVALDVLDDSKVLNINIVHIIIKQVDRLKPIC